VAKLPEGFQADQVFCSQAALACRHNVQAFLLQMYVNANESRDEELKARLATAVPAAIKQVP